MKKEEIKEYLGCVVVAACAFGIVALAIAALGLSFRMFRWIAGF